VQGRGDVRIVDASTDSKKNLVIVEFDDNPFSGPAIYQIELTISFGGKP
jgi:hypothetical protein